MGKCQKCISLCCRYIALQIDTPKDIEEHENIRWYLAHKDTSVFVEDGEWFVEVKQECKYLQKDYSCGIYDKRPLVCRKYTNRACENSDEEFNHELSFDDMESFDKYLKEKKLLFIP